MTKIVFSGIGITNMRGSSGAVTISRNRSGNYSKINTMAGGAFDGVLGAYMPTLYNGALSLWKILSPDAQEEWNRATRYFPRTDTIGTKYFMSGFNLFVSQYCFISIAGGIPSLLPVLPVSYPIPESIVTTLLTPTDFRVKVNWVDGSSVVPSDVLLVIGATKSWSAGRTRIVRGYGACTLVSAGSDSTSIDILSDYLVYHPAPINNMKIFVQAYAISALCGMRSHPVRSSETVS